MSDPFYRSHEWRRLRALRLSMDGHRCTTPGCHAPATVVDHIVPRRQGGGDVLGNLRSLCVRCDNQVKERPGGQRPRNGTPIAIGCHPDGSPRDPRHPWYK